MPKITSLPPAGTLTGAEVLPLVQSEQAKSATTSQLLAFFTALIAGMAELHSQFFTQTHGSTWVLNGGAPVTAVTKIFANGVLQDVNDFTITLATGVVTANISFFGDNRIDVYWIE